jgi:hypothetical protein
MSSKTNRAVAAYQAILAAQSKVDDAEEALTAAMAGMNNAEVDAYLAQTDRIDQAVDACEDYLQTPAGRRLSAATRRAYRAEARKAGGRWAS